MNIGSTRKINFTAVMSFFSFIIICGLILFAEFILVPKIIGYPRDLLLVRYISPPGSNIDGQLVNAMGFTGDVIKQENLRAQFVY